ncbi:hypothetical protein VTN96DRAFT_425 [Rasamsonia emersonii]
MNIVAADNRTPIVNVLTWFLLTAAVLSVITRLGTKYFIRGRLSPDDYIICVSLLFCALQSICVSVATGNRYGQPIDRMSADQINAVLKSSYAADLLYIASLFLSKLSVTTFVKMVVSVFSEHKTSWVLMALLAVWGLTSEFAAALQCQPPRTWDFINHRCFNRAAWWNYFDVSNIVTEIVIIAHPTSIVFRLHTSLRNKVVATICFLTRLCVIVAIVCALVYRNRTIIAPDPMFDTWPVAVCVQVVQSLSIATACSPQFKPFLESLQSSGLRLYELPNRKNRTDSDSRYPRTIGSASMVDRHERALELNLSPQPAATRTVVTAAQQDCDANSQSSQAQIIRETRTWAITEQREQRHSVAGVSDTSAQGIDRIRSAV